MEAIGRNRDDIEDAAAAFTQATRSLGPVTAKDDSGAVTVTVSAEGRISGVVVAGRWVDTYTADTLTGGINEAFAQAAATRLEQWGTSFADPQTPVERMPAPMPHESLASRLRDAVQEDRTGTAEATMERMRDMLHELNESIEQVKAEVDAHLAREYSGRSPSGHARATIAGNGNLLDLKLDRDWLDRAHPTNIGREATQAIHEAYRKAGTEDVDTIIARSPLGRLQRLSEDPFALAQELGLRD
jgi:DNA-binding protein YbaB